MQGQADIYKDLQGSRYVQAGQTAQGGTCIVSCLGSYPLGAQNSLRALKKKRPTLFDLPEAKVAGREPLGVCRAAVEGLQVELAGCDGVVPPDQGPPQKKQQFSFGIPQTPALVLSHPLQTVPHRVGRESASRGQGVDRHSQDPTCQPLLPQEDAVHNSLQ